jgi:thymidylate kinase
MINYPETLEQIEKLKAEGVTFDKVIFLNDTSENEGAVFLERNKNNDRYDHAKALEDSKAKLALYQEQYGEDQVIIVDCNGSVEEVFTKLLTKLDPF